MGYETFGFFFKKKLDFTRKVPVSNNEYQTTKKNSKFRSGFRDLNQQLKIIINNIRIYIYKKTSMKATKRKERY